MERTEDEVRDEAKIILGFDKKETGIQQGTGQITTFNQLGIRGVSDKPDGWYIPDNKNCYHYNKRHDERHLRHGGVLGGLPQCATF